MVPPPLPWAASGEIFPSVQSKPPYLRDEHQSLHFGQELLLLALSATSLWCSVPSQSSGCFLGSTPRSCSWAVLLSAAVGCPCCGWSHPSLLWRCGAEQDLHLSVWVNSEEQQCLNVSLAGDALLCSCSLMVLHTQLCSALWFVLFHLHVRIVLWEDKVGWLLFLPLPCFVLSFFAQQCSLQ